VPAAGSPAGTPLRGNPAVRAAATVLRELPPAIAHRVQAVHAPNASDVSVRLGDGVVIVWGDTSRAAEKAKELALLMRTDARGYDVSAPGTAVTQG
jgi:cell division protein FtsQ